MRTGRWSIVVTFAAACGGALSVPSQGGRGWTEVTSDHFVVWTDGSAQSGRELLRQFERRRRVMVSALAEPSVKARTFVIALRSESEVNKFVPPEFIAQAWGVSNLTRQPGILIAMNHQYQNEVVNHELAHVVSYGIIKNQPEWLAEGLATYFETAALQPDDSYADIGHPRHDRALTLRGPNLPSVADVFACDEDSCKDYRFYAKSWAIFAFLVNQHPAEFGRYLQRLNDAAQDDAAQDDAARWRESFPELSPDEFDRMLYSWLRIGEYRPLRIKLTMPRFTMTERSLGDADVLALRGLLYLRHKRDKDTARKDAAAALAIDRTNILAHQVMYALDKTIAADDARATAAAHPDDHRAWLLIANALGDGDESDAAIAKACSLAAGVVPACRGAVGASKDAQR